MAKEILTKNRLPTTCTLLKTRSNKKPLSVGLVGNCADILPRLVKMGVTPDIVTDQTSAHDELNGYVPHGMTFDEAIELRTKNPDDYIKRAYDSMVIHTQAMLDMQNTGRGELRCAVHLEW